MTTAEGNQWSYPDGWFQSAYFLKRAGLYVLLDQRDLALDDLNTTLALSPDLYDALQLRSQIYDEKGEYEICHC